MTLSEKLQSLRRAAGLSQEQLAEQLGVTRQAVSKWETGEGKPDIDNLLPLARLLHTSKSRSPKRRPSRAWAGSCGSN